ncbi:cartilage-associated protein-like [Vanessa tameamea]|uniref:Cartilage-associated protein-like n=1 Tax=Vanessa tameamea TaxID=334116 RepID=A0A8B8I9T0_VANTA
MFKKLAKFIIFISIIVNCGCLKFSSLDTVYKKAVDAFSKERWSECILQFEGSLHLYKVYKTININCRLKCKSENHNSQFTGNIEDLKIFEYFLTLKDCLSQCQQEEFESVHMYNNVSDAILTNMQSKKPYEYLHLCYFEMNALPKAASAAYTYLVANSDDIAMKRNVEYYIQQPEVDVKEVIDLESEDYQILYKLGIQAYKGNNWGNTIANMEETLTDYLAWENSCRAECEHQSEQEVSPEFIVTIANNILPLLICRQKCQENLKPLYDSGAELLADVLNYLQISYYHSDRFDDAAKAVASYLTIFPSDEDMLENKRMYETLVQQKSFTERSEIVHYLKRDKYEKHLLNFFLKQDNSDLNANSI